MRGFPECTTPFPWPCACSGSALAHGAWGGSALLQRALGRQEGRCAGEGGSGLLSVPPRSRDRLAQRPLGPPWAEPGPQGDASGCRLLQPPPWHWGETLQGDRAIAWHALPPLTPRALPAQARPLMRARVPALSPPWGLGPPPPWREACLSPAWHSAELGPQRPHCAHPTDHLEDGAEAPSTEALPLGRTVLETGEQGRGASQAQLWRGMGLDSGCSSGMSWPLL